MNHQRFFGKRTSYICILLIILKSSFMEAQNILIEGDSVNYVLENILKEDQILREKFNSALENYGKNSSEFELAAKNLINGDLINQDKLDCIFDKYGWLTPPSISKEASMAYFYVIQHAQIEFQKRYKNHVIKAFELGIIDTLCISV